MFDIGCVNTGLVCQHKLICWCRWFDVNNINTSMVSQNRNGMLTCWWEHGVSI